MFKKNFKYKLNYSNLLTIDEKKDLTLMNQIINKTKIKKFDWKSLIKTLNNNKDLMKRAQFINKKNYKKLDTGPELWNRALGLIPWWKYAKI